MTFIVLHNLLMKNFFLALVLSLCVQNVYPEVENSDTDLSTTGDIEKSVDATESSLDKPSLGHPVLHGIQKWHKHTGNETKIINAGKHGSLSAKAREFAGKSFLNLTAHMPHEDSTSPEVESETTVSSFTEESGKATEESSTVKTSVSTEKPSEGPFAVRDAEGKICILAKFDAVFDITSLNKGTIDVPKNATSKGKCGDNTTVMKISGPKFLFIMEFEKGRTDDSDEWYITSLELQYRQKDMQRDATSTGKNATFQAKNLKLFNTSLGQSYLCPREEVITLRNMHTSSKADAILRMKEIHMQPFDVKDGKFSKAQRCDLVAVEGTEETSVENVQSETVPLAVGLTLAILTLVAVLGFSIHRAYTMRKVDYNGME